MYIFYSFSNPNSITDNSNSHLTFLAIFLICYLNLPTYYKMNLCLFFTLLLCVFSVKRHEFKTCKDLSFCQRNRFLASSLDYKILYFVPPSSITQTSGVIRYQIQSSQESSPFLTGETVLLTNNLLHVYLDEISPLFPRFRTNKSDILNLEGLLPVPPTETTSTRISWETGDYKYYLYLNPYSIQGFYKDTLVLSVNERSLFNFDRYRSRETVLPHSGSNIVDTTGLPGDKGMWDNEWKGFTDKNPRGPSSVGIDFTFANTNDVYGIPEHADSISLKDTTSKEPYRLYNLDVFEYELNERMALYGAVPFMLSKHAAVFWNNPSETWIDIETASSSKKTHWFSETGVLEFILFLADGPRSLVSTFTMLTGPPLLPPLFALGYHQCRWNYFTQHELLEVEQGFEEHNLPLDVIWLDIDHTPQRTYFTWNYGNFPTPLEMLQVLHNHGRKLVNIVDPHLTTRPGYATIKLFREQGTHFYPRRLLTI